jgi:cold shock CspA family protein
VVQRGEGYGFVAPDERSEDLFVHYSSIGERVPQPGGGREGQLRAAAAEGEEAKDVRRVG